MTEPLHEIAHISHAELLTPKPEESLRFFVDVLGMEIEAREGQSVFLRGWGDYQRYCLKLTESDTSGMAHMALRTWSPEALERRVAAVEAAGLGLGWSEGDVGHGPAYRCTDPDGHVFELLYEVERYVPPPELVPSLKNQPQRYVGRGAAIKRLDHINVLAADVGPAGFRAGAARLPPARAHRARRRHRVRGVAEHEHRRPRADLHHDAYGARGRLHHLAFWVDTREECLRAADLFLDNDVPSRRRRPSTRSRRASSSTAWSPVATASRSRPAGYFVFDPDEPVVWTRPSARARRGA